MDGEVWQKGWEIDDGDSGSSCPLKVSVHKWFVYNDDDPAPLHMSNHQLSISSLAWVVRCSLSRATSRTFRTQCLGYVLFSWSKRYSSDCSTWVSTSTSAPFWTQFLNSLCCSHLLQHGTFVRVLGFVHTCVPIHACERLHVSRPV